MRTQNTERAPTTAQQPQLPVEAVLSFLKDTRGLLTWTARDLAKTLKISAAEVKQVIAVLQLQGYIAPASAAGEWLTTEQGNEVAGSSSPRFSRERVEDALTKLRERINGANKDKSGLYTITEAVAFGDFLRDAPRVQAPDVGVALTLRGDVGRNPASAVYQTQQREFLKKLRGRDPALHVQPYRAWMSARTHRKLS